MRKFKVGIVGITGYGGAELSRLMIVHPNFDLCYGSSSKEFGRSLCQIHPHLAGLTELEISQHPGPSDLGNLEHCDVAFLALPHGFSMKLMPYLPKHLKIVDLSSDYRLSDPRTYEANYKKPHRDSERISQFTYGLTEIYRDSLVDAQLVANPGCFATAVQLALFPFAKYLKISPRIIVDAKTGSSGSGASATKGTHHPSRQGAFYAYKLLCHQHLPEIQQTIDATGITSEIVFQVHSTPLVRGIFVSCYLELVEDVPNEKILEVLETQYESSPFVRILEGSPDVHWVRQSNFADISFVKNGRNLVVFCAIDNLMKGAAGQAVQNMNLMLGLDEKTGLFHGGGFPG